MFHITKFVFIYTCNCEYGEINDQEVRNKNVCAEKLMTVDRVIIEHLPQETEW